MHTWWFWCDSTRKKSNGDRSGDGGGGHALLTDPPVWESVIQRQSQMQYIITGCHQNENEKFITQIPQIK